MDERDQKQRLLDSLLDSVKQCQIRFGGKSELATESEDIIASLCARLEAILNHGLKTNELPFSSLREMVTSNFHSLVPSPYNNYQTSVSPWPFIKIHLNKHELERYMLLKSVKTDAGRARAWLRSSLNEHSLERYLHLMVANVEKLPHFYEAHAFLVDQERNTVLPQIAAGLTSILFAIKIDNEALNFWTSIKDNVHQDELVATVIQKQPDSGAARVKKKKKGASQVISFDSKQDFNSQDSVILPNQDQPDVSASEQLKSIAQEAAWMNMMSYEDVHLEAKNASTGSGEDNDLYSRSPADAMGCLSIDTSSDSVTKLTPLKNSEVGALIPLSPSSHDDVMSEDSMSIKSFGEDQDYASALSSITVTPQPPHYYNNPQPLMLRQSSSISSVASAQNSTLSREDLKQALLSVMERKEELQEQCHAMKKLLEKESASTASLKQELLEVNRKSKESADKMQARVNSLSRENELLKHQLKKYVGAVQKLRDGPQAHETLAQLEGQDNNMGSKYVDYHFEASEYERKLIQVAEMHGELLEFNEHLQKLLQGKDSLIRRLREELVDLRGPLPDEDDHDETMSIISEAESNLTATSVSTARSLINIWIPSVFLSGSGNGTHHVYQVYLRIRDEEWNIYRRYSEFYALHKDLQKKDRLVTAFDFPPKKTVGNKAEKFVEDRRKRLQSYLRQIVNLMIQTNASLLARPDKEQVILLMPFFAENSHLRQSTPNAVLPPPHQRPPLFQRRRQGHNESATQLAI